MTIPGLRHEPGRTCPNCKGNISYSTNPFDPETTPDPGDISVCFSCGSVGTYTEDLSIRRLTKQEYEYHLEADHELREVLRAWNHMKKMKEQELQ